MRNDARQCGAGLACVRFSNAVWFRSGIRTQLTLSIATQNHVGRGRRHDPIASRSSQRLHHLH